MIATTLNSKFPRLLVVGVTFRNNTVVQRIDVRKEFEKDDETKESLSIMNAKGVTLFRIESTTAMSLLAKNVNFSPELWVPTGPTNTRKSRNKRS